MEMIRIEGLSVDLGQFHLRGINLAVEKGEYVCIIGPTGAGKTVLIETIAGFHKPSKGKIILEGEDITWKPPEKRGISVVYQDYMLFPHMTVYENIAYGAKKKIRDKKTLEEEIERIAEIMRIKHLLHRKPETLSGGEQQRVAIARAIISKPKLLLMDEPFSALDTRTTEKLRAFVKRVAEEYDLTVIHVTHDIIDVWSLADKVAIMNDGRIIQYGEVEEVFSKPANNFVADFIDINILEGEITGFSDNVMLIRAGGILLGAKTGKINGQHVRVFIRPEDIYISSTRIDGGPGCFEAIVKKIIENGPYIHVYLSRDDIVLKAVLTRGYARGLGISPGKPVYVLIRPENVRVV